MELGLNGIRLVGKRSGVGRYIEYLIKCWEFIEHPFDKIKVYTPRSVDIKMSSGIDNVVIPTHMPNFYWEQILMPKAHGRNSLLFCPSYVLPFLAQGKIVLTHLGSYERYPDDFTLWQKRKSKAIYKASARKADLIITVSESSKRDIIEFYGVDPDKITVIPLGVDTGLFKPKDDELHHSMIRRKYTGQDVPFVLYVGKFSRRRNIPSLIKAFISLKREKSIPHKLLLVGTDIKGDPIKRLIRDEHLEKDIIHIHHTSHKELVFLYQACDLFIYPSSYEGFGIPVLEAMACGVPVITLRNTAFMEFANGVAYLANDGTPGILSDAIGRVLCDESMKERMRRQGPIRAKDYEWSNIASKTMDILIQMS